MVNNTLEMILRITKYCRKHDSSHHLANSDLQSKDNSMFRKETSTSGIDISKMSENLLKTNRPKSRK